MEDLPLGRIAVLVPEFCSEGPALGQNTDDDYTSLETSTENFGMFYFKT